MKVAVLGVGFQGTACAMDLIQAEDVETVFLVDQSQQALDAVQARLNSSKIQIQKADITDYNTAVAVMQKADVTISAVPYFFNEMLTKAAIEAKSHFTDMGGNTDVVLKQLQYTDQAKAAGVTIVPDMGLAPGFANLLAAELIEKFETVDSVRIRVGGLPQNPQPPMNYQLFFSVEGLINEYIGSCLVLKDGRRESVKSLTEVEALEFPEPIGKCEAFHTLGGCSTLPWTYEGRVKDLDYKTIRYPGHCEQVQLLEWLGLFSSDPVTLNDGTSVAPRQLTGKLLTQSLSKTDGLPRDYVVVRVVVQGQREGRREEESFEFIDAYNPDQNLTAMMRTTAFPVSIVAQILGRKQTTQGAGAYSPEVAIPHGMVRQEMEKRGLAISHKNRVQAPVAS